MLGFAGGSALAGRFADRFGIASALSFGAITIGVGYFAAAYAPTLLLFGLSQILIGLGTSTGFGPLIADVTHWFERRRGIAVGLCSSGNYFAGTLWPPIVQHFIANDGWRPTHVGIGIVLHRYPSSPVAVAAPPARRLRSRRTDVATRRQRVRTFSRRAASPALDRRRRLLRRDVDAASAYRRLLQRSRLWRRARRRHARGDDGVRHRQPDWLGLYRRLGRRASHVAVWARSCKASRCCFTRCSTG